MKPRFIHAGIVAVLLSVTVLAGCATQIREHAAGKEAICQLHKGFFFCTCSGRCTDPNDDCLIQFRKKGSEDPWQDTGAKTRWCRSAEEYRCNCQ